MNIAEKGTVYLVGAGPGDPDLLTVKAARLLASCDVVLHDDLVPPAVLGAANPRAWILNVGKRCGMKRVTQEEINFLMIDQARKGQRVVRLKIGDPLVFGRAAEEMDALRLAGIPVRSRPRNHRCLRRRRRHPMLVDRSSLRVFHRFLHRPSCGFASALT